MSCNRICIVLPEPHLSKMFPWIDRKDELKEYLDWIENLPESYLPKVSKEKPITEIAMDYLERNFYDLNHVICFPSLRIDKEMNTPSVSQLFTELFTKKLKNGIRAVLSDYDLYQHAFLLNFKLQENIMRTSRNRVLIFYSKLNLILIVRAATSSNCINQESKNCLADVKYFVSVNKPVIKEKIVTILGIVACTSVERKDLKKTLAFQFSSKFKWYKILFICKDELQSYKTLNNWWGSKFLEYCSDKISQKRMDDEPDRQAVEATFKQIIGLTMLIIAKCDENLPTLESDTQKQIKTMILNHEQITARDDEELKKVIIGGFGSGKSVVGKEIVKSFYENSPKTSTLYYICCDHFSLFQCEMKEFTDTLKKRNVEIVCESLLELWQRMCKVQEISENNDVSLPKLLQYYSKNGRTEVNFVLDELPGEYVTKEDANQLKLLFSTLLKKSLVVFLPKSIVKNRHLIIDGEKQELETNCFDEEKIGMKNIILKKSMRVTNCIQLLIDSAQETICKSNTVLYQPNKSLDQLSKIISSHENYNESNSKTETLNDSKSIDSTIQKEHTSRVQPKDDATTVIGYHDDDLDQGANILASHQKDVKTKNYMETQFVFKSGVIGHSIKGEKPKIINLPNLNLTEERSAKILSVVLEKICLDKVRSTAVVCNNMQEVGLVAYAIDIIETYKAVVFSPHLQKYSPTMKKKISVTKKLKKSKRKVLVTDSRAMCGSESEVLIVFVNPEEYYLRHVITDVCARCNSHLIVMVLSSENKVSKKAGTIKEVLDNWSLKKIVQNIRVEITSDYKFIDCFNFKSLKLTMKNQLCILTDCSLYINDKCEEFKNRCAKVGYINYIQDKKLKINDENNIM